MELIEVIQSTRDVLRRSSCWTQGANGRDRSGKIVRRDAAECAARDIEGAFRFCAGDHHRTLWPMFRKLTSNLIGPARNIFDWNDKPGRRHADVLNFLDDALDALRWGQEAA